MKKNIWIFNHYATNMYFNEGGRHYWFAENLQKHGYRPVIFCANVRHNKDDILEVNGFYEERLKNNIPFVFVKTTPSQGNGFDRVKNMYNFYKNLFKATKHYLKENEKPDLILASSVHPLTMVAGIKIAKKLNIPCVCEVRDLWPESIFAFNKAKKNSIMGKLLILGENWIYKNADSIIFTKEGDKDYIVENKWDLAQGGNINMEKIYYINNGLDISRFNKSINEHIFPDQDLESDKFIVTYTGAIRPVNNIERLVEVAEYLKEFTDIRILIYGDGSQKEILENKAAALKLENIIFKGHIDKKYIPYILSKSSINILNYSQHRYNWSRGNSSNKLFEYMASGNPVISTVKMGYSIIERNNCGVEIYDANAMEIGDQILKYKALGNDEFCKIEYNALNAVKEFDFQMLTQKLIEVIEKPYVKV